MKKKVIERPCQDCKKNIPFIKNRIRCLLCYKLKIEEENKKIQFINDD